MEHVKVSQEGHILVIYVDRAEKYNALSPEIYHAIGKALKRLNDDPELREEDYAAAWMAVQNLALAALEMGLGTHIKTGAIMADPAARAAAGVKDDERIVAVVNIGEPADVPPPKARERAAALTTWTK